MSVLTSVHDRICFKTNRSLVLALGVIAAVESAFKVVAYTHNKAVASLSTFEWFALPVAFAFFVLISASARCTAERIISIFFAVGVAANFIPEVAHRLELSGAIAQYPLWSIIIWISTALTSFVAAVAGSGQKDE